MALAAAAAAASEAAAAAQRVSAEEAPTGAAEEAPPPAEAPLAKEELQSLAAEGVSAVLEHVETAFFGAAQSNDRF